MGVPRQGLRDLVEPLLGEGVCPAAHRVTDILPELLHRGHRVLSLLCSVRRYASLSNSKFLNTKPEACHAVLQNGVACRGEERGKGTHHRRLWEGPRTPYFRLGASLASRAQKSAKASSKSRSKRTAASPSIPFFPFPSSLSVSDSKSKGSTGPILPDASPPSGRDHRPNVCPLSGRDHRRPPRIPPRPQPCLDGGHAVQNFAQHRGETALPVTAIL